MWIKLLKWKMKWIQSCTWNCIDSEYVHGYSVRWAMCFALCTLRMFLISSVHFALCYTKLGSSTQNSSSKLSTVYLLLIHSESSDEICSWQRSPKWLGADFGFHGNSAVAPACISLSWSVSTQTAWRSHTIPLCRLRHLLSDESRNTSEMFHLREHWDLPMNTSTGPFFTKYNTLVYGAFLSYM